MPENANFTMFCTEQVPLRVVCPLQLLVGQKKTINHKLKILIRCGERALLRPATGFHLSFSAVHNVIRSLSAVGVCPASTKTPHSSTSMVIPTHLLSNPPLIYLCTETHRLTLSPFTSNPTMVSTRTKNKDAHPATPVMTKAAKRKAGIKTKQCTKKVTKDETIRLLQARLTALENPDGESFSQEPLVCLILLSQYVPNANYMSSF